MIQNIKKVWISPQIIESDINITLSGPQTEAFESAFNYHT